MNKQKQIEAITKRFKILEKVPESERLKVFKESKLNPLYWGVLLGLLGIWLYFFGWEIIQLSGNLYNPEDKGWIMKSVSMLKKTFIPAFIPAMIIIITSWSLQGYLIKKIVKNEYGNIE